MLPRGLREAHKFSPIIQIGVINILIKYIVSFMIVWTLSNDQVIFCVAILQRTYEILLLLKRLSRIGTVHIKLSVCRSKTSKKFAPQTSLLRIEYWSPHRPLNPFMPTSAFNICCPRDCVSLKPLRVDSALRALSTLRGLRGAPEVPPLCRETQSLGLQMKNWKL